MNPTQKPERGGTIRVHGFWNDPLDTSSGDSQQRLRLETDSHRSRRSDTEDSDRITRWNTARDISESRDRTPSPQRRTVSTAARPFPTPNISDRKRSGPRQDDNPKRGLAKTSGQSEVKVSWHNLGLRNNSELEPSQAIRKAERHLSDARLAIEAKKEARRQRRSLKQSGDYLGVQGINPETGRLDILTPSNSDESTCSGETEQKTNTLKATLRNARHTHKIAVMDSEGGEKRLLPHKAKEKPKDGHEEKEELAHQTQNLGLQQLIGQWASAQEPKISPITPSQRGCIPLIASE